MSDNYNWKKENSVISQLISAGEVIEVRDIFVVRDEDIYMVAYPKSGTHWLVEIVCLIQSKGDPIWVKSFPTCYRSPWLELDEFIKEINNKEGPRLITSHLHVKDFPKSFFGSKAKVIYLFRNPRDCLVSGYYFWLATTYCKKPESLESFFEDFIQGKVPYGSWFEHTRGWMSLRNRDNVLLLSYEELKKDTRSAIEKICEFLGKSLEPTELDSVLKNSSFQVMKENWQSHDSFTRHKEGRLAVMRTGITGDWKYHFTVSQAEKFDKIFQEKMAGFPKELFPWE